MSRTGRRAKERERKNIIFIILGSLTLAALVGASVYAKLTESPPPNARTLCPATGPLGHVVLLVDKSDPMTFTQRKDFEGIYQEIIAKRVPKGHLLSVYALGDDFRQTADPIIELCNPGDGSDANIRTGNPAKDAKVFNEKYLRPLLERSPDLVTDKPGKASPLLEMMQFVSITGFRKHDVRGERRLIVVSDMLHNTPQFSMYKGIPKFEEFSATTYGTKAMTELDGVKVELQVLSHSPQLQKPDLWLFWEQYVYAAKGKMVLVNRIKG